MNRLGPGEIMGLPEVYLGRDKRLRTRLLIYRQEIFNLYKECGKPNAT
jgi:hypothetical protein